jgi:radical SAM protein (TIGR01212 family)
MEMRYRDFGSWIRERFPFRVQKLSVDAGFSCPNRDGRIGTGGCIYCDNRTFNPAYCDNRLSVTDQLERGKAFFARKYPEMKYLAYFQAYTNTYAATEQLAALYEEALAVDDVVGLVIGTRPDCMSTELLDYLSELNNGKGSDYGYQQRNVGTFVLIEYGIESANDATLRLINRGHDFACVQRAVEETHRRGLLTGGHVILGLPSEDREESMRQAHLISGLPLDILKIHQMQVIEGTPLAQLYREQHFHVYSLEEYIELVTEYIRRLRPSLVLERFVSQSPAHLLVAPKWGIKNHEFTALLHRYMEQVDARQGDSET